MVRQSEHEQSPLWLVLETVARRRAAGEQLPDDEIVAAHPEHMPELGAALRRLEAVEAARRAATVPERSDGSDGSGGTGSGPWSGFSQSVGAVGQTDAIPGYELHGIVGRGGMGVVYRATHVSTQRDVAIKVMGSASLGDPKDRARFEREAAILIALRHPNIVTVYDAGFLPEPTEPNALGTTGAESRHGRYYLVMDYVDGVSLDDYVRRTQPGLRQKLELFAAICDAVNAAHLRGVIHRDLKPSNILVTDNRAGGNGDADSHPIGLPHLLDFGLATFTEGDGAMSHAATMSMTMTGQFIGSLPWASPEQAEALPGNIDVRTDVYSLGVVLFHLLSDQFPYAITGNLRDVVDRILECQPTPLSKIMRGADEELETIVQTCLAKDRERRYQSAGALAADVRRYLAGEAIEAKRDSGWYVLRKSLRRHRVAVMAASAFVVLIAAFGVTMTVLYRREQLETNRARRTLTFLTDVLFQASSQRLGADATLSEMLDHASEQAATNFVDDPEAEALVRYTIGNAYETIWRKQKAVKHLRAALALYERTKGRDDPETLRCKVLLGMVLAEMRNPESVRLQQEALAARRRAYGEHHPLVARSLGELAFAMGLSLPSPDWAEVERDFDESIRLFRETAGNKDTDLARMLHAYAAVSQMRGQLQKADRLYAESLSISRPVLGEDHEFTAECMREYANMLRSMGRLDEAESLLREVEPRTKRLFGVAWVPGVKYDLARVLVAEGNLDEAKPLLVEALALWFRYQAANHGQKPNDVEQAVSALSDPQTSLADAAPPIAAKLVGITNALYPSLRMNDELAKVLEKQRDLDGAEKLLRANHRIAAAWQDDLVKQSIPIPSGDGWYVGWTAARLGKFLVEQGRYDEAVPQLQTGCDILDATLAKGDPRLDEMHAQLQQALAKAQRSSG